MVICASLLVMLPVAGGAGSRRGMCTCAVRCSCRVVVQCAGMVRRTHVVAGRHSLIHSCGFADRTICGSHPRILIDRPGNK